jgi:outer membrane protein OmpA-like peptidoglycan-associated protein
VLTIEGHTDNRGNAAMNKKLSQQRADAIRNYFVAHGMEKSQLKTAGYGPDQPIADNATAAGRARNRRVVMKAILQ